MSFSKLNTFIGAATISPLLGLVFLSGCGAVSTIGGSSSGGTTLASIPKATGPVVGVGASSLGFRPMAATSGVVLANLGTYSWTGKSKAFCQLTQMTRDTIRNSSQADKIMCYIGAGVAAGAVNPPEGNMYDGEFHYFTFAAPMAGSKVKMKVRRGGPGGTIDLFQMQMCESGSLKEYVYQSIDANGNVTMTSKHVGVDGGNTFSSNVSVSGVVNSNFQWTSKTITASNYSEWNGSGFSSTYGNGLTLEQNVSTIQLRGYQKGSFSYTSDAGVSYDMRDTFDMKFASVIQLLNASALTSLGLGDGTAKANMSFTRDLNNDADSLDANEFNFSSGDVVESWNGDTRAALADPTTGDHYTTANALTLPASAAPAAISFGGGETWDCSSVDNGQSFGTINVSNFSSGISACDTEFGGQDNDWVQCDMN